MMPVREPRCKALCWGERCTAVSCPVFAPSSGPSTKCGALERSLRHPQSNFNLLPLSVNLCVSDAYIDINIKESNSLAFDNMGRFQSKAKNRVLGEEKKTRKGKKRK